MYNIEPTLNSMASWLIKIERKTINLQLKKQSENTKVSCILLTKERYNRA